MSSGIPYPPPDNILPIFDREEFIKDEATGSLDIATATAFFVRYPTEIRPITLAGLTSNATATFSGALNITDATASSNKTTGALVVAGGVGVGGTLNTTSVATTGTASFTGAVSITNTTASSNTSTGALVVAGGVGVGGALNTASVATTGTASFSGAVSLTNTTASSNTSTGALVVSGGVGVGGALNTASVATTGAASFSGEVSIANTTASSNTSTGALVITGGAGIGGALNVGGKITAPQVEATTNGFYAYDGANEGRIYQVGADLILSSSGNKVALATGNSLVFKNDNTTQLTAYTGREVADDADVFTLINNAANPATQRYILSSTFSMGNITPTNNFAVSAINRFYCFPVRLIKGQIANGAGFYLTAATAAPSVGFSLYSRAGLRVANIGTFNMAVGTRMEFQAFASPYIVPETDIYYVGLICTNLNGGTLNMVATPANAYLNYGNTTMTAGILDKAAMYVDTTSVGGGRPVSLTGLTPVIQDRVAYGVIYSNSPN